MTEQKPKRPYNSRGDLLFMTMDWPGRKIFTIFHWVEFMQQSGINMPQYLAAVILRNWAKTGLIRRCARGVYTTEIGTPNLRVRWTDKQYRALVKSLPEEFTLYQLAMAYNEQKGYAGFGTFVLNLLKKKGLIVKGRKHGLYQKAPKNEQKQVLEA